MYIIWRHEAMEHNSSKTSVYFEPDPQTHKTDAHTIIKKILHKETATERLRP